MNEGDLIHAGWGLETDYEAATPLSGPPSGVAAPQQWFVEALGGGATAANVRVNSWSALGANPVAAAVKILSEDIAKLPIKFYKDNGDGREIMRSHPALYLLARKPNRWMTPFDFKACMVSQLALNGNAVAIISRRPDGRPSELIPVETGRVALWTGEGQLFYYVSFTNELNRLQFGTSGALFPAADILHVKWAVGWQGLWGYSPIQMGRETIANAIVLDRYAGNLYANYADIGGVLSHPGHLGDEALNRLRKQWESRYTGEGNRGRTAILEEGMKFEKMAMTAADAEFVANRKFSVEEVARMYRIPPHKLMDLTRTIQSNIEEQSKSYVDDTLGPIIQNFEDAYTDKLLVAREPDYIDIEHDVSAFVRGRPAERWEYYTKAILHGVMTPNEVRVLEGLDKAEGGDEFYRSNNMVPRDAPVDQPPQPSPVQRQIEDDTAAVMRRLAQRVDASRPRLVS